MNACKVPCVVRTTFHPIPNCLMPRELSISLFTPLFAGTAASLTLLSVAACSPTYNWRDVRPDNTRLSLLLPCKPDKAQKTVPMGGQATVLTMLGCDAGGATFAVVVADLGDASKVASVLAQWQSLTLSNMKAGTAGADAAVVQSLKLAGASIPPAPVLVKARGRRADGSAVTGQAAYFAQGSQVFQVVLYADKIKPELSETFFSSLKFE